MILEEGLSKINIPDDSTLRGPGTKRAGFYNQDQVLNRDITIALLSVLKPKSYLDGFGGTGIRGIRVTRETGIHSAVSEINRRSVEIIKENQRLNEVELEVYNEPFESVVSRHLFDFVDVDPYGSIVPYLDLAISHVKNGGYLGLTATDLSALTGSVAQKTRRRYGATISNDRLKHESGIRLLLAYTALRAAALDREIIPQVAFWRSHYYRLVVKVKHGAGAADRNLQNIRNVNKSRELSTLYPDKEEGPIWTGKLCNDENIEGAVSRPLNSISMDSYSFLSALPHEDRRLYFFELSDFASHLKRSLPSLASMSEYIEEETGKRAFRTHFSPTGIKAQIDGDQFLDLFGKKSVT